MALAPFQGRLTIRPVPHDACPDCGGALTDAGSTSSEMLDWIPAQLRVVKVTRPKCSCRACGTLLQVDGYAGFEQLVADGTVVLAACWSHARRKFYELHKGGSPVASEALQRIAALYQVEASIRGQPPAERQRVRSQQSRPLVEVLKIWLELKLAHLPGRSRLAEAIRYALNRWSGLCQFLDDGRIDLDTNPVERSIRPVALGRKNALFAGSDGGAKRWAVVGSLVETAKLNHVEPYAWLRDVLSRMVDGHPAQRLDELLPWAVRQEGVLRPSG